MTLLLLLLSGCVYTGLSEELHHGSRFSIRLHPKAQSVEFIPEYSSDVMILWEKNNSPGSRRDLNEGRGVINSQYVINHLTRQDSGDYIIKDKRRRILSTKTLSVIANTEYFTLNPGENFTLTFNVKPALCNIIFLSDIGTTDELVRDGRVLSVHNVRCEVVGLMEPCGISIEKVQHSCSGQFSVTDEYDNAAFNVFLSVPAAHSYLYYFAVAGGVLLAALCCCCCVRRCRGKKSSEEDTPDAHPAVYYHEFKREPAGRNPDPVSHPSLTNQPAQPSHATADPVIFYHPAVTVLPPPEVSAPAVQTDAPSISVHSDPDPQFNISFFSAFPLHSDSANNVYTSDKLNFL